MNRLPFSPIQLANDVVRLMEVKAKGIALRAKLKGEFPREILSDPTRLRQIQILVNLVANAVKFTEQGCISIRVAYRQGEAPHLNFSVEDSGIGMSPEQVPSAWMPGSSHQTDQQRRIPPKFSTNSSTTL